MNNNPNNLQQDDESVSIRNSRSEESQWDDDDEVDHHQQPSPANHDLPPSQKSTTDSISWGFHAASPPLGPSDEQTTTFMVTAAGTAMAMMNSTARQGHTESSVVVSPLSSMPSSLSPANSCINTGASSGCSPTRRFTQWREQRDIEKQRQLQQQQVEDSVAVGASLDVAEPLELPVDQHVANSSSVVAASQLNPSSATDHSSRHHPPILGESIFERLQSRAQPDAILAANDGSSFSSARTTSPPMMMDQFRHITKSDDPYTLHHQLDSDDCALLSRTALAQKRVKVLQLLILGWIGLVFGWLATFFSGTLCNYATARYKNNNQLELHFGLWKYTPVDAVVMGSDYCVGYSAIATDAYSAAENDSPLVARVLNVAALGSGTFSLIVVWLYLILGCFRPKVWLYGVWASWVAAPCQLASVVTFFITQSACRDNTTCHLGPGASLALMSTLAWAVFGWEMLYNTPGSLVAGTSSCSATDGTVQDGDDDDYHAKSPNIREEDGLMRDNDKKGQAMVGMSSLELADFKTASKEYMERFHSSQGSYCPPNMAGGVLL